MPDNSTRDYICGGGTPFFNCCLNHIYTAIFFHLLLCLSVSWFLWSLYIKLWPAYLDNRVPHIPQRIEAFLICAYKDDSNRVIFICVLVCAAVCAATEIQEADIHIQISRAVETW